MELIPLAYAVPIYSLVCLQQTVRRRPTHKNGAWNLACRIHAKPHLQFACSNLLGGCRLIKSMHGTCPAVFTPSPFTVCSQQPVRRRPTHKNYEWNLSRLLSPLPFTVCLQQPVRRLSPHKNYTWNFTRLALAAPIYSLLTATCKATADP